MTASPAAPGLSHFSPAALKNLNREGKFTLLHFWSTWCKVCEHELITLENLHKNLALSHVQIITVAIDSSAEGVRAIQSKHALTLPLMLDQANFAKETFNIQDVPLTLLMDRNGKLVPFREPASEETVYRTRGPQAWDDQSITDYFKQFAAGLEQAEAAVR